MIYAGLIVQAQSGALMKVASVEDGIAELLYIDENAGLHVAHLHVNSVRTMYDMLQARSRWPAMGHLDEIEIAEEERLARLAKKAKAKKAQQPKRSKRIKRK